MCKIDSDQIKKWAATLTTALTLLLTLTSSAPDAVAQSTAFHTNGASAVGASCPQPSTCFFLSVNRITGGAVLFFDISVIDVSTGNLLEDTSGFGQIPDRAFQVQGQSDSLNVDTSTLPPAVFVQTFCTFDPVTGNATCNPFSGGVVTGTWTAMRNIMSFHNAGTSKLIFSNMVVLTNGTSDFQVASANVNLLGTAFVDDNASVGTTHNTSITIQKVH